MPAFASLCKRQPPIIAAEGKLQTSLFVENYLHVRQPVARLQNGNYCRGGSPRTGAALLLNVEGSDAILGSTHQLRRHDIFTTTYITCGLVLFYIHYYINNSRASCYTLLYLPPLLPWHRLVPCITKPL
jgi:hypothetical protein